MSDNLEEAWKSVDRFFATVNSNINLGKKLTLTGFAEDQQEREVMIRSINNLSYEELCAFVSDPRWYDPLPDFLRDYKEDGIIRDNQLPGFIRFNYVLRCLKYSDESMQAVESRIENHPELPLKPSFALILTFHWREYYERLRFYNRIQQEYSSYHKLCVQYLARFMLVRD